MSYVSTGIIDPETIVEESTSLTQSQFFLLLQILDEAYHNGDELVDDQCYEELLAIYQQTYGEYRVTGAVPRGVKVRLPHYLPSLDKVTDEKKLLKWTASCPGPYVVEDKVDGITLLVKCQNGKLSLYTRGGGTNGLDVTRLVPYLNLPVPPVNCAIRGELVMTRQNFELYRDEYKNSRAMIAGQMETESKFNEEMVRSMSFFAYRIVHLENGEVMTPEHELLLLRSWGYSLPQPTLTSTLTLSELTSYYQGREKTGPYEMDGLVIYQNQARPYPVPENDDGFCSIDQFKNSLKPEHVIAFKTVGQTAVVTVTGVHWECSRSNRLTPVIEHNPVTLNDTTCTYVTANNKRELLKGQIGLGSELLITKSGNTIPKILKVLKPAAEFIYPDKMLYGHYTENEVHFFAAQDCPQSLARRLLHFITTLGIQGFGEGRMLTLVHAGVREVGQLLLLTTEQLMTVQGWGDTLSQQLVTDLREKTRPVHLAVLLDAIGMFPGIGKKRWYKITTAIPDLLGYTINLTELEKLLQQVPGIKTLAEGIVQNLPHFVTWIEKYPMIQVSLPHVTPVELPKGVLSGQQIVFSGFRDQTLERLIGEKGGRVTTGVSGKTTLLVLKDLSPKNLKSKALDAQKRGVALISKEDFVKKYGLHV